MKNKIWLCAALWPAAVLGAAAPSSCPQPQMQVEQLIVANDGRDRGYPGGLSLGDVDDDGDPGLFVEVVVRWPDGRVERTKKIERDGKTVVGGPRASLLPRGVQGRVRIFTDTPRR